ncbi:hypothetical protein CHISP_1508 [Chitinispirillum alkaliphilum]|nr:hypothetical protein CHISP_1508 [Chitinispirillum alkaliphilum]
MTLLVPLTVLLTSFLIAVLMIIPGKIYRGLAVFCVALAFLFWLQGNILVWNYGVLDGRQIDWGGKWFLGLIDLSVWFAVLSVAFIFRKQLGKRLLFISVVVILIQSVALYTESGKQSGEISAHSYSLSDSKKFLFSEQKNIILLILDAFQADVMQEILCYRPEYKEVFEDFIFYRNAASAYSKTYATIPLFLTGEWYENQTPIQSFLRESFSNSSITSEMMNDGWRVDLFPWIPRTIYFSEAVASNIVPQISFSEKIEQAGRLLDLSLFRTVPQIFKPFFLNNYQWRITPVVRNGITAFQNREESARRNPHPHPAIDFVQRLSDQASADLSEPSFKMYHLGVPHEPFLLNEELEMERLSSCREGFVRHSIASLEVARRVIEKLKNLEIYDQSMILVVSDHGGGEYRSGINYSNVISQLGEPLRVSGQIPDKHLESALPLIMIKPFNSRGPFEISDAPVSLEDIAHTILKSAGLQSDVRGRNIFDIDVSEDRVRRYMFYEFRGWDRNYLPAMTEYTLSGHSWLPQNWKATGRVFDPAEAEPARVIDIPLERYKFGQVLNFKGAAPSRPYLSEGWCEPEMYGTWSRAEYANIDLPLHHSPERCVSASFHFNAFTAGDLFKSQTVELYLFGEKLTEWQVCSRPAWYRVTIPESIIKGRDTLEFTFVFPDAASPADHRIGMDTRNLGVSLSKMVLK